MKKGRLVMNFKSILKSQLPILLSAMIFVVVIGCEKTVTQPPPPPASEGPILLVANYADGAGYLSLVPLDSGSVQNGIAGLGNTPSQILRSNNTLYVLNSGSQNLNVFSIDNSNVLTALDTIDVSFGGSRWPIAMALADNGDMYISNFNDNSVSIMNIADPTDVLIRPNVGRSPAGILARGDKIYVCITGYHDETYDSVGYVKVLSALTKGVVNTIEVGVNPQYMAYDGSGQIHVVCTGNYGNIPGSIYKISARADTVTQTFTINGVPGDICIAGRHAYLANYQGHIYRYDISTGAVLNNEQNPILVSQGADRITARSDGSVYVSCGQANTVDRVVGTTRTNSWTVGDGPGPIIIIER